MSMMMMMMMIMTMNNSSELTHRNGKVLGWLPTTYYWQASKRVAKWLLVCGTVRQHSNTV